MPDREGNQRGNTASLDKKLSRSLLRQFKRNARNAAERIKHDPWILGISPRQSKVERTGDQSLFADYERRRLAALALLYPPETHASW